MKAMMSMLNDNRGYVIAPLVEELFMQIDDLRVDYTKNTVIFVSMQVLIGLGILTLSLFTNDYSYIIGIVMNILVGVYIVHEYLSMIDESLSEFVKIRGDYYGYEMNGLNLNEERMIISYGILKETCGNIKAVIHRDRVLSIFVLIAELFLVVQGLM